MDEFKYWYEEFKKQSPKAPRWFLREQVKRYLKNKKTFTQGAK